MLNSISAANPITHIRQFDNIRQLLQTHLTETAAIARELAAKPGLPEAGELPGMCISGGILSVIFFLLYNFQSMT